MSIINKKIICLANNEMGTAKKQTIFRFYLDFGSSLFVCDGNQTEHNRCNKTDEIKRNAFEFDKNLKKKKKKFGDRVKSHITISKPNASNELTNSIKIAIY